MTTTVRLLGRPEITTDGDRVPVRGQKSWALLALLALSNRPISRQRVATMLFDRADDPLGALRWTLAQLFWPRTRARWPSVVMSGRPSRRTVVVMVGPRLRQGVVAARRGSTDRAHAPSHASLRW